MYTLVMTNGKGHLIIAKFNVFKVVEFSFWGFQLGP
jgi:hypothetical protein